MCPQDGDERVNARLVGVTRKIGALRSAQSAHPLDSRRLMSAPISILLLESTYDTLVVNKKGSVSLANRVMR